MMHHRPEAKETKAKPETVESVAAEVQHLVKKMDDNFRKLRAAKKERGEKKLQYSDESISNFEYKPQGEYKNTPLAQKMNELEVKFSSDLRDHLNLKTDPGEGVSVLSAEGDSDPKHKVSLEAVDSLHNLNMKLRTNYMGAVAGHLFDEKDTNAAFEKAKTSLEKLKTQLGDPENDAKGDAKTPQMRESIEAMQNELNSVKDKMVKDQMQKLKTSIQSQLDLQATEVLAIKMGYRKAEHLWVEENDPGYRDKKEWMQGNASFTGGTDVALSALQEAEFKRRIKAIEESKSGVFRLKDDPDNKDDIRILVENGSYRPMIAAHTHPKGFVSTDWSTFDRAYDQTLNFMVLKSKAKEVEINFNRGSFDFREFKRLVELVEAKGNLKIKVGQDARQGIYSSKISEEERKMINDKINMINQKVDERRALEVEKIDSKEAKISKESVDNTARQEMITGLSDKLKEYKNIAATTEEKKKAEVTAGLEGKPAAIDQQLQTFDKRLKDVERACDVLASRLYEAKGNFSELKSEEEKGLVALVDKSIDDLKTRLGLVKDVDKRLEVKAETKADAKADAKAETKADAKADAKAETKADAKADAKESKEVKESPEVKALKDKYAKIGERLTGVSSEMKALKESKAATPMSEAQRHPRASS